MHVFFCMLVIVSVFISMSSATEGNIFDVVESVVVHARPKEEQSTPKSDDGKRRKRSISSTDETNIVNKINSLRSSVGASNMNYLPYSSSDEYDAANWTSYCEYDADAYTYTARYIVKYASYDKPDLVSTLEKAFSDSKSQVRNQLRSVHLRSIGVGSTFCLGSTVNGKYYSFIYITAFGFSNTSSISESVQQYTLGKECTTCLSGSYWCYEGLCRDDCTSQISACSCYTGCTNCTDWNRRSCKCPSRPTTDAVTLNCYNKGETTHQAMASMAMIVASTLALFYLQ